MSLFSFFDFSGKNQLLKPFSTNEISAIYSAYKQMYLHQIRNPSADNNSIINYNMKLQNYVMMNSFIHMITAGSGLYFFSYFLGGRLEETLANYLG